jgi:hypothetical protein
MTLSEWRVTLRRWGLKARLGLITLAESGDALADASASQSAVTEGLIPPEYVESEYVPDPGGYGEHGEYVARGEHWMPHGREVRLHYELDRERNELVVRRQAFFAQQQVSDVEETQIDYEPDVDEVWGGPREIPDTDPSSFAEHHFHRDPEAELVDGFVDCLSWKEDPEDYPVNPVEIR